MDDVRDLASVVAGGGPVGPFDFTVSGEVPDRLDYGDDGNSDADDPERGDLTDAGDTDGLDLGSPLDSAAAKQQRHWSTTIIAVPGDETLILTPGAGEDANRGELPADRAGAPTDAGRPAVMIARDLNPPSIWTDDPSAGIKLDTPSPLAAPPFAAAAAVVDALPSPGGMEPALAATDPVAYNTWRVPPTPWDEQRYIGGPFDG